MIECEGVGKNVEKAIEDALIKLKANRDDVDIRILETGGLFKKARVKVSISQDCIEKYNAPKKVELNKINIIQCEENLTSKEETMQELNLELMQESNSELMQDNDIVENKNYKDESIENISIDEEKELEIGKEFILGLLDKLQLNAQLEAIETEEEINFKITGENSNCLIGYRGDCLNSLQHILTVVTSKNNRKAKRVRLDIDDYREKRKQTLISLAKRVAAKVDKTGRQCKLEPMSAYERRIIHTTVQEFDNVTSMSKGDEPYRYLIIKKK